MSDDIEPDPVHVVSGIYAHSLPPDGGTVGDLRSQLAGRMKIDPGAVSIVDGVEVDEGTVLTAGQVLNFVVHSGEMG